MRTLSDLNTSILGVDQKKVEVVVMDNASQDSTSARVLNYKKNIEFDFRYYRNKDNIGWARNVHSGIKKCRGLYVWAISDDDIITQGAIQKILSAIDQTNAGLIFVNYDLYSSESTLLKNDYVTVGHDYEANGKNFFEITGFSSTFGPSNVFRKESWENVCFKGKVNQWYHLYCSADILINNSAYIVDSPLIVQKCLSLEASRGEKKKTEKLGKLPYYIKVHFEFVNFLRYLDSIHYPKSTMLFGKRLLNIHNPRQIIYHKVTSDNYNYFLLNTIAKEFFNYFKMDVRFWILYLPLIYSPNILIKISRYGFRKIKYK